jgi:hypothetical protein
MKTKWSQGAPYNNDLPIDTVNTTTATNTTPRVMTGCVATAAAQIIAYWGRIGVNGVKYKVGCKKIASFTTTKYNGFSFKTTELPALEQFDYDNMKDTYSVSQNNKTPSRTAANNAVSQLMQYVGYAFQLKYSRVGTGGNHSTARDRSKSYLSFNSSLSSEYTYAHNKERDDSLFYFELKVYNELINKRPVLTMGSGIGAHAFVCDGYTKSTDMFHINWGWGGSYNGDFKFSSLIPKSGTYDYNTQKEITIHYYPQQFIQDIINGDFNGDGKIDLSDSEFLSNAISNGIAIPEYDVNNDGYVDIKDVNAIIDRINNKGLKKQFNLSINGESLMNDNFDYNNEINYEYKTINIDKNNRKVKIITRKRGSSGSPTTTEESINLPTITNPINSITSFINGKSTAIKNKFNAYVNTLSNRYSNDVTKNALTQLNNDKDNLIYSYDDYVDLGLSVKWASKNIGATNPEDTGNFYAWAETSVKSTYTWANYKYYSNSASYYITNNIAKNNSCDAAYVLDNSSCLPSSNQFQELIDKCIWTKITKNNKTVWEVQGPNGNVIYFPVGGCSYDGKVNSTTYAYCWTSTYYESDNNKATGFQITTTPSVTSFNKRTGFPIRPIKVKNNIEMINLGLPSGTKWGNMNLGANMPHEVGNVYAWGELLPKKSFNLEGSGIGYKYFSRRSLDLGSSISKNIKYDAAYKLDSNLSLPTADQWTELINNCTWTETTVNNVKGFEIKGTNNNTIFLPFTGYMAAKTLTYEGTQAYYASGTIYSTNIHQYAKSCLLKTGKAASVTYVNKYVGTPIRAIAVKGKTSSLVTLVDLGLSVNWANMNIGATNPEDSGNFYSWGELSAKSNYTWDTYINYATVPNLYHNLPIDINKNLSYDAAYVLENHQMCMPTKAQCQELINNCTWTKKVIRDSLVWEATGPNGNSIILPLAGVRYYWCNQWSYNMYYWTSEQNSDNQAGARIMFSSSANELSIALSSKYYGIPIRPVAVS